MPTNRFHLQAKVGLVSFAVLCFSVGILQADEASDKKKKETPPGKKYASLVHSLPISSLPTGALPSPITTGSNNTPINAPTTVDTSSQGGVTETRPKDSQPKGKTNRPPPTTSILTLNAPTDALIYTVGGPTNYYQGIQLNDRLALNCGAAFYSQSGYQWPVQPIRWERFSLRKDQSGDLEVGEGWFESRTCTFGSSKTYKLNIKPIIKIDHQAIAWAAKTGTDEVSVFLPWAQELASDGSGVSVQNDSGLFLRVFAPIRKGTSWSLAATLGPHNYLTPQWLKNISKMVKKELPVAKKNVTVSIDVMWAMSDTAPSILSRVSGEIEEDENVNEDVF